MAKVERKCVSILAQGIALVTVAFSLVRDAQREAVLPFKADGLFVDRHKFAGNPTALAVLSELIKDRGHLPKWVILLLHPWIDAKVIESKKAPQMLPSPHPRDRSTSRRLLDVPHHVGELAMELSEAV
jgi:hypothetical protein